MESYLFNRDGKPLTNGKKEPFEELVRKCAGTPDFFLSSIFSSQKRTGNFLSLDRSERKELLIRELFGLDRLRLIAAAAKEKGEQVARTTLGLEGQARSLKELVEAGVEDPAEVEARLAEVSSRFETLEAEKRTAQQRLLELQAAEASRKPLLAEVETLKQRLRKTDAEITETKRQIGRDESLLTGKKDLADLTERGATLATRIDELHRQIREIQSLETTNREAERTVQVLDPATCFSFPTHNLSPLFSATFSPYANISFVFIYIPASVQSLPQSSFVFSNVPASFGQKRKFSSRLVGFLGRQDELSE